MICRREARLLLRDVNEGCSTTGVAAHVPVMHVDRRQSKRAHDLVQKAEGARDAVGVVVWMCGGFVQDKDLQIK
jgi:hypothetical protein